MTHDPTSEYVDAVQCGERISGNATAAYERGMSSYFDVPLYTHVIDNLYVGGAPETAMGYLDLVRLAPEVIFNLAPWFHYPRPDSTVEYYEREMFDSDRQDLSTIDERAKFVAKKLSTGKKVLVHCQAGLNRSNLVAARALMFWKGMTAKEAIDLLREKRCDLVLCNKHFEDWLLGLDDV